MAKKISEAKLGKELAWLSELRMAVANAFVLPGMPERIRGADFKSSYGEVEDEGSEVREELEYPVAAALRFVTGEDARVRQAVALLRAAEAMEDGEDVDTAMVLVGELMSQAHGDYTAMGLGAPETDAIVRALLLEAGPSKGVLGARISGGGSGGTVAVLCRGDEGVDAVRALLAQERFCFGETKPSLIV